MKKIIGTKLRRVIFPQIFKAPSSETTGRTQKVKAGPKMVGMLYPHAKFGSDLSPHGGERGKMAVFCVFLFVTLTVSVCLYYRRAHCEGYIVAIYRSILI